MTDAVAEVAANDQQEEAAFADGFNAAMGVEPTVAPEKVEPPKQAEEPAPVEKQEEVKPEEVKEEQPTEEEQVTLSSSEAKNLLGRLNQMDRLQTALDKAHGRLGALQETISKLTSAQASGGPVEISDEDVAEISADFPEFGKALKSVLGKTLSKVRGGTPTASAAEPEPAVDVTKVIDERLAQAEQKSEMKLLSVIEPGWQQTVTSDKWKLWLAQQPEDYRNKIDNSWDALEVRDAIKKFEKDTAPPVEEKAPEPKKPEKAKRLEAAVTPKGVATPETGALDEDAAFTAGFASVRKT